MACVRFRSVWTIIFWRARKRRATPTANTITRICTRSILTLFNEHLVALVNGEKVTLPRYNFETGERETAPPCN